jgi:hypothetical protein
MKNLFQEHRGEIALIAFTNEWKLEGKVVEVFDEYIVIETYNSGPERLVYVSLTKVVRVHFKTPGT